jgi:hypothetical protein
VAGSGIASLLCRLYTQGPARVDVSASGHVSVFERELTLSEERCLVDVEIELTPSEPPPPLD